MIWKRRIDRRNQTYRLQIASNWLNEEKKYFALSLYKPIQLVNKNLSNQNDPCWMHRCRSYLSIQYWLILSLLFLWHFLRTSKSPPDRSVFRKRNQSANVSRSRFIIPLYVRHSNTSVYLCQISTLFELSTLIYIPYRKENQSTDHKHRHSLMVIARIE